MQPRTKYINLKYHHFSKYFLDGKILVQEIRSADQKLDMLTKNCPLQSLHNFENAYVAGEVYLLHIITFLYNIYI